MKGDNLWTNLRRAGTAGITRNNSGENKIAYHYDWFLLFITIVLSVLGLAFLASSLSTKSVSIYQSEFLKQLFFGFWIGGGLMFFLARTDYHKLFKNYKWLLWLTIGSLSFLGFFIIIGSLSGSGVQGLVNSVRWLPIRPTFVNGALRWISFTFLPNFQPAELAKLTILIYFAKVINDLDFKNLNWVSLKRPIYVFLTTAILIYIQPDLGSVILLTLILLAGMWSARVPFKVVGTISIIGLTVFVVTILFTSYRSDRLRTFLDFSTNANQACQSDSGAGKNFQVCQVRAAISRGGMWGVGYGNSQSKQNNLIPEISTDGIMGIIGEEMGFVASVGFLLMYLIIFWRGLKAAQEAPDAGGKALAAGIAIWILSQAFINVAGITGLLPLKGTPLPFVSEGGSALVLNLAAVGVLLNISGQSVKETSKANSKAKVQGIRRASFGRGGIMGL